MAPAVVPRHRSPCRPALPEEVPCGLRSELASSRQPDRLHQTQVLTPPGVDAGTSFPSRVLLVARHPLFLLLCCAGSAGAGRPPCLRLHADASFPGRPNKVPQHGRDYGLAVLEARGPKSRYKQGGFLLEGSDGGYPTTPSPSRQWPPALLRIPWLVAVTL